MDWVMAKYNSIFPDKHDKTEKHEKTDKLDKSIAKSFDAKSPHAKSFDAKSPHSKSTSKSLLTKAASKSFTKLPVSKSPVDTDKYMRRRSKSLVKALVPDDQRETFGLRRQKKSDSLCDLDKTSSFDETLYDPVFEIDTPVVNIDDPILKVDEPILKIDEPIVRTDDHVVTFSDHVSKIDDPIVKTDDHIVTFSDHVSKIDDPIVKTDDHIVTFSDHVAKIDDPITISADPSDEGSSAKIDDPSLKLGDNSKIETLDRIHDESDLEKTIEAEVTMISRKDLDPDSISTDTKTTELEDTIKAEDHVFSKRDGKYDSRAVIKRRHTPSSSISHGYARPKSFGFTSTSFTSMKSYTSISSYASRSSYSFNRSDTEGSQHSMMITDQQSPTNQAEPKKVDDLDDVLKMIMSPDFDSPSPADPDEKLFIDSPPDPDNKSGFPDGDLSPDNVADPAPELPPKSRTLPRERKFNPDDTISRGFDRSMLESRRPRPPRPKSDAGSYVALTLLGKPQSQQPKSPDSKASPVPIFLEKPPPTPPSPALQSDRVTAPLPVDVAASDTDSPFKEAKKSREFTQQKLDTIKAMHSQALKEYEELRSSDFNPQNIKSLLEDKLKQVKTLETLRTQLLDSYPDSSSDTLTSRDSFIITEDSIGSTSMDDSGYSPQNTSMSQKRGASKHAKSDSVPVTIYKSSSWSSSSKSIIRSNSDAQSKQRKFLKSSSGSNKATRSESERSEAFSLPSTADAGSHSDSSLNSTNTSPTPLHARNIISESMDEPMDAALSPGPTTPIRSQIPVISTEDDEFSDEDTPNVQSPFCELSQVEKKPAYMAVLLHYLISNSDPAPLFFYLITESYTTATGGTKDMRKWAYEIYSVFLVPKAYLRSKDMHKWAYEIYSVFLVPKAPLKVPVDDALVSTIDDALMYKYDKEDYIRNIFNEVRNSAETICKDLLADFKQKADIGLGNIYGVHEVQENMTKTAEANIIDKYLMPHFDNLQKLIGEREGGDQATERNHAMSAALVWFLRHSSVKPNGSIERCPSFVAKEKRSKLPGWNNKKNVNFKTHQFLTQHYMFRTMCNFCGEIIVGVGYQGYQCQSCELNYHRHCIPSIEDTCLKRKSKRSSTLVNTFLHKGSRPTSQIIVPPPVKVEEEKEKEKRETTTPPSAPLYEIKSLDHTDPELTKLSEQGPSVSNLVQKYDTSTDIETPVKLTTTELGRSESMKGQADYQKPNRELAQRRAKSDLDIDDSTVKGLNSGNSGSSSASSLSASTSVDTFTDANKLMIDEDSDFDVEPELPPTKVFVTEEIYKKLKPKEKKRLDVINELFYTERTHVRNLKVLDKIFCKPMTQDPNIPPQLVSCLFPNLEEIIALHGTLNYSMKTRRAEHPIVTEVADLLLQRFDGEAGRQFRDTCAIFCRNQSYALDLLKQKQRRDERVNKFFMEAENNALCRRLQLKDLLPTIVHRLTKYPLLIENLCKYTTTSTEEHVKLELALQSSKHILDYVNQAVRECENHQRLVEFNRHIDRKQLENQEMLAEFKTLDLTQHTLLKEGPLVWRVNGQKLINLQVVLLKDLLILFQKQDDKLLLKCQSTVVVAGKDDTKYTHSPIIKLTYLMTRHVATDKKGFFLVNTSNLGPQIYELVAHSKEDREKWFKAITEAADTNKRQEPPDTTTTSPTAISALTVPAESQLVHGDPDQITLVRSQISIKKKPRPPSTLSDSALNTYSSSPERTDLDSPYDRLRLTDEGSAATLIQPEEVTVTDTYIARAQSVLTPLEKLRRNDEKIREGLQERQHLISEILGLDVLAPIEENDLEATTSSRDPRELVATSLQHSTHMVHALAEEISTDNVYSPADQIASEEESSSGESTGATKFHNLPACVDKVQLARMANRMNEILTNLMAVVSTKEDEREALRDELRVAHEQLNILRTQHIDETKSRPRPASMVSVGSSGSYCMEDSLIRTGDATDDGETETDAAVDSAMLLRLASHQSDDTVCPDSVRSANHSFDDADHFEEALSFLPGLDTSQTTPTSDATEISPTFESTTDDFGCGLSDSETTKTGDESTSSDKNSDVQNAIGDILVELDEKVKNCEDNIGKISDNLNPDSETTSDIANGFVPHTESENLNGNLNSNTQNSQIDDYDVNCNTGCNTSGDIEHTDDNSEHDVTQDNQISGYV